ncbi:MAG: dihydrofolate reductase family protein [Gammaproteobacteria bacterium]|nr:dihydrofolate reductase family protein [Gammaproteobacteria bacterium]
MKTTLFLSVSIDGLIADKDGIPNFPGGAWEDWCAMVNDADNVIAGRSSFEQLQHDEMASVLNPKYKVVLSSQDVDLADSGWQHANSPAEALEVLRNAGVDEAIVGGGRAVAHSFMREQLIDYIVIDLQPVAFGVGTPVFGDALDLTQLKLLDSRRLNESALRLRYQVLRDGT